MSRSSINKADGSEPLGQSTVVRFVKGTGAGFMAAILLQPLQVIKTSMQITPINKNVENKNHGSRIKYNFNNNTMNASALNFQQILSEQRKVHEASKQKIKSLTFRQATNLIYKNEGYQGFLRGLGPSLFKNSLMTGQYFSILYFFEQKFNQFSFMTAAQVQAISSILTKTIQSIWVNPIVVIKTRLEVVGFNEYNSVFDACQKIYATEGLGAFFTGLKISLIRDVPFAGIFYPIYSFFRTYIRALYEYEMSGRSGVTQADRMRALAAIASVSAMMANIASCTLTHPIDLIRTRALFKHYNQDLNQHYSGIFNGVNKIYKNDGFQGFFKGLLPRIARKGLGSIICWTVYEFLIDKQDMTMSMGGS